MSLTQLRNCDTEGSSMAYI